MRSPLIPEGAEIIRTYKEYDSLVSDFFETRYNLLIAVGRPGLSKSHCFERRLSPTSHLIRGCAAPLQCYIDSYIHRNKLLIFDDAETLWKRQAGRVLLRSLCEHHHPKLVQWTSTAPALKAASAPQSFTTTSKVAFIANRFVFGQEEEYAAIADRGHVVFFDPAPVEVHQNVGAWFWDQEVFDYIGERLHLVDNISARLYLRAAERHAAGGDWRKLIEECFCKNHTQRIVQALEADTTCTSVEDRARKFVQMTRACRATYFNIKRHLTDHQQLDGYEKLDVPKIQLRGMPPPKIDLDEEVAKAQAEDDAKANKNNSLTNSIDVDSDDPADWWKRPRIDEDKPQERNEIPFHEEPAGGSTELLRRELQRAIENEDYERAARLRDEIQQNEGRSNEN